FSASGLKCLEFNVSADLGGWEIAMCESMYLKTPLISGFLSQSGYAGKLANANLLSILFGHFIRTALDKFPGTGQSINTAIVLPNQAIEKNALSYFEHMYRETLGAFDKQLKGKIISCDYSALNTADDHVVRYNGEQIHVLVELYGGVVPPDYLKAVKRGNLIIYNGRISGLLSNKLNLALLSENQESDSFSEEEKEIIRRHIPWSRKVVPGKSHFEGKPVDI
ncbi:MAG: hypothetical protein GY940_07905, partial [bacterium]|nr:hypothetical protein [bacterium]